MKYYVFKLTNRSDASGFYKAWYLTKPHEGIRDYEKFPPEMALTYDGFDTFEEAESWIKEYGERNNEYTILPIIKR